MAQDQGGEKQNMEKIKVSDLNQKCYETATLVLL